MTKEELFNTVKEYFRKLVIDNKLNSKNIKISSKALTSEEAIGITKRKDYPIIAGKEIMLQAEFQGAFGQAFTDAPSTFEGTLEEVLDLDINNDFHARGLFTASLNAVMCKLGLIKNTIHCKNEEPEICGERFVEFIKENYADKKIALVGYQPSILENLSKECNLRVLDLNSKNIGETRYGIIVEDGVNDYEEVILNWADIVLCTGSTFCNGTMTNFINIEKPVIFFGTTAAGVARIIGLERKCFYSK